MVIHRNPMNEMLVVAWMHFYNEHTRFVRNELHGTLSIMRRFVQFRNIRDHSVFTLAGGYLRFRSFETP